MSQNKKTKPPTCINSYKFSACTISHPMKTVLNIGAIALIIYILTGLFAMHNMWVKHAEKTFLTRFIYSLLAGLAGPFFAIEGFIKRCEKNN